GRRAAGEEERHGQEGLIAQRGAAEQQGGGGPGREIARRAALAPGAGEAEETAGRGGEAEPEGEDLGGSQDPSGEVERTPGALESPRGGDGQSGDQDDEGPRRDGGGRSQSDETADRRGTHEARGMMLGRRPASSQR